VNATNPTKPTISVKANPPRRRVITKRFIAEKAIDAK
jgi:hypothetical protein